MKIENVFSSGTEDGGGGGGTVEGGGASSSGGPEESVSRVCQERDSLIWSQMRRVWGKRGE